MHGDSQADDWNLRFGGVLRLYGAAAGPALRRARVLVVGIGGVGTWVVEALARSGVGTLGLMDMDDVCITNTNRQVHAVAANVGRPKTGAMAERARQIHPGIRVEEHSEFFGASTAGVVEAGQWDAVVDAIDSVPAKCLLLALCARAGVPVVACGGAGGKRDGTLIRTADLAHAVNDPLLKQVRKVLRREHGFPRDELLPFGIPAVFSKERPVFPWSDGAVCATAEPGASLRLDCASGFGTAAHVTGGFGLAAAGLALEAVLGRSA